MQKKALEPVQSLFDEDITTLREENTQHVLNILHKAVLNVIKIYRDKHESKLNMVDITRKCLHDTDILIDALKKN